MTSNGDESEYPSKKELIDSITGSDSRTDSPSQEIIQEQNEQNHKPYHNEQQDEEDSTVHLHKKLEAIDDEQAAITPELQRNVGFTRPGAFRSAPLRAGSFQSSSTTQGATRGGAPPIEAVLVDHENEERRADDDVFTAEPLASVKEFVSSTPRCIMLLAFVLCMLAIISAAIAVIVVVRNSPDKTDEEKRNKRMSSDDGPFKGGQTKVSSTPLADDFTPNNFFTHHAVIFGSKMGDTSECTVPFADKMKIAITCDAENARLRPYMTGGFSSCSAQSAEDGMDDYEGYVCSIDYNQVSYFSFDCITDVPHQNGYPITSVEIDNPLQLSDCNLSEQAFTFMKLMRFCRPHDIKSENICEGAITTDRGVCINSSFNTIVDHQGYAKRDHDQSSKCEDDEDDCIGQHVVVGNFTAIDVSECFLEFGPETEEQEDDSLEVILKANVTSIVDYLRQPNSSDRIFWED